MIILPQCVSCRHLDEDAPRGVWRCRAFPGGIPDAIRENKHDHREPYEGDGGIRFEPRSPGDAR